MIDPTFEEIDAAELGEMRRKLLQILNDADPEPKPTNHENVCRRIQRLCHSGVIPEPIGDLMHVVRKYRNRAEYQGLVPTGMEAHTIRSAWAAIENWHLVYSTDMARNVESRFSMREVTA